MASENASRTVGACFAHRAHIPYRRRPFLVPSFANARKRCPHCTERSSEHLGGQKITARNAATGKKITAQSSSAPCDSVNTSSKHLPEVLRHHAPASAPQPLPETLRQPRHPASLDTLCVTKCHYLSFGKCFDVTEACRQR